MPRHEIGFGGLFNAHHESKVPQGRCWAMQNVRTDRGILEGSPRYELFGARTSTNASDVGYGFGYGKISQNEVQRITITGTPTGGTFTITFSGQTTANIAYNADSTAVLTALEGLSNIAIGDVQVSGGPFPGAPMDITFTGAYANTDVALMTTTDSFTGGSSPASAVTERIKGGETEVYLAAVKHSDQSTVTMYKVDASTGVFTSIATGLTASDWFYQQYGDRIFAVNATDGLSFLRLGGSWNDGVGTTRPKAPVLPPTFTYSLQPSLIDFSSGWTFAQTGLGGSPTLAGSADSISIINGASAVTAATQITLTATNSGTVDYQFSDFFESSVFGNSASGEAEIVQSKADMSLINNDTTTIDPLVESYDTTSFGGAGDVIYSQFANSNRTIRDNVKKIVFKFTVESWPASKQVVIGIRKGFSWMNDNVPFVFSPNASGHPTAKVSKIRYAYSYKNETTGAESQLSEEGLTQDIPANHFGCHVVLTLRGSSELTTSDRIYVYRKEVNSGVWRRLPTDSNNLTTWGSANVTSGTTTFTDKWMEEELQDFPPYESASFSNSRATLAGIVIGLWKQSLVVGASKKLWLSFSGFLSGESPRFAPDPDDKASTILFGENEADNPDIGRTVYMADDRAEDVLLILGQDSLYSSGPNSSYGMVGESPGDASRPRRLPSSRGAVGKRAGCRYGGGVEVGAEDGLWYHSIGRGFSGEDNGALISREETAEIRRSWITTLLGSSYSGLAIVEHEDVLWAFNGTKYLYRDRDGRWSEGTFDDSVLAALSVRSRGLKFMDSRGRIHSVSADYTDDNGTAVTWRYETGILDGPSTKITDIELQVKGNPTVTVWIFADDGDKFYSGIGNYFEEVFDTEESQFPFRRPLPNLKPGMRYKIIFTGTVGVDEIHTAAFHVEAAGKQY